MKKICGGKANGFLSDPNLLTLSYNVPNITTPYQQKYVLQMAMWLAKLLDRKVEIPDTFYKHSVIPICLLFDMRDNLVSNILATKKSSSLECKPKLLNFYDNNFNISINDIIETIKIKDNRLCLSFLQLKSLSDMIENGNDLKQSKINMMFPMGICNPHKDIHKSNHMCTLTNSNINELIKQLKIGR